MRGPHFGVERKSVTLRNAETLQRGDKFHDWMELCKRSICQGDKTTWICLWDNPPREPKPISIQVRLQVLGEESDTDSTEENGSTNAAGQATAGVNTRARAANSNSSQSSSNQPQDENSDSTVNSAKNDMLKREAVKLHAAEAERIRIQKIEIFGHIWGHVSRDLQNSLEMDTQWTTIRNTWNIIKLLQLIEDKLCSYSTKNKAIARDQAD